MSNTHKYQIDFQYFTEDHGYVTVESIFNYEKAFQNPDSDWESKDWMELEAYSVHQGDMQLFLDIPESVIYQEMRNKIKDLATNSYMYSNEGF